MQVKNRIHVVLLKILQVFKRRTNKNIPSKRFFLWLCGLLKDPLQFSSSSYPYPPPPHSGTKYFRFYSELSMENVSLYLFIFFLTED